MFSSGHIQFKVKVRQKRSNVSCAGQVRRQFGRVCQNPASRTASGVLEAGVMVVAVNDRLARVGVWFRVTLNPEPWCLCWVYRALQRLEAQIPP